MLARQQIARKRHGARVSDHRATALLGKIEGDGVATDEAPARGVVVYHPALGRTAEFDWRRGVFVPLAGVDRGGIVPLRGTGRVLH